MATENQINANRENAQHSTGPVTDQGKATSSHNAVKTGLTGQTVLLKTDDVAVYHQHLDRFQKHFSPATDTEKDLVQDLADTEWRLLRITPLESGILALGRRELAPLFADESDPAVREALLEAKLFLTYRRDLNNLSIQQSRLRKHRDLVLTELKQIQQNRKSNATTQAIKAMTYYLDAVKNGWKRFELTDFGFDFTLEDFITRLAITKAKIKNDQYPEVTSKLYLNEVRAEFEARFGKK
jgi:hypothetical protein